MQVGEMPWVARTCSSDAMIAQIVAAAMYAMPQLYLITDWRSHFALRKQIGWIELSFIHPAKDAPFVAAIRSHSVLVSAQIVMLEASNSSATASHAAVDIIASRENTGANVWYLLTYHW